VSCAFHPSTPLPPVRMNSKPCSAVFIDEDWSHEGLVIPPHPGTGTPSGPRLVLHQMHAEPSLRHDHWWDGIRIFQAGFDIPVTPTNAPWQKGTGLRHLPLQDRQTGRGESIRQVFNAFPSARRPDVDLPCRLESILSVTKSSSQRGQ
jgi:hypothetical protein